MARIIKKTEADPAECLPYEHTSFDHLMPTHTLGENCPLTPEMQMAAMLAEARAAAERKVQEAYDEGLRRGMESGRAQYLESVGQSAEGLRRALIEVTAVKQQVVERLETEFLELTRAITSRILHREAWADPQAVQRVLRAVLNHLAERERLTIRVNPRDREILERENAAALEVLAGLEGAAIIPDESVAQGGCVVETGSVLVDARLDAQLERILEELSEVPCEPSQSKQP